MSTDFEQVPLKSTIFQIDSVRTDIVKKMFISKRKNYKSKIQGLNYCHL